MPKTARPKENQRAPESREKKSKAMRYAVAASLALHIVPALSGLDIGLTQKTISALAVNHYRKARMNLNALLNGEAKFDFSVDGLFDRDVEEMSFKEKDEWRKRVTDMIIYRPDLAKKYVEEGKLDLDDFLEHTNFRRGEENYENGFHGRFFIETESLQGVDAEDTRDNAKRMKALYQAISDTREKKHQEDVKKRFEEDQSIPIDMLEEGPPSFEVEFEMLDGLSRQYSEDANYGASFVGDLLHRGYGNCSARAKLNLAIVKDMYWAHVEEVKIQLMGFHARTIIKMGDGWYAMDGGLRKIPPADLTGTAIIDSNMYVKNYLKTASDVKILDENANYAAALDLRILIMGALLVGNDEYLNGAVSERLRSVFEMTWDEEKKPKEKVDAVEVELMDDDYTIVTDDENGSLLRRAAQPEKKEEEPEYVIPKEKLFDIRITGEIDLSERNIKSLEQLRGIEVSKINLHQTGVTELSILENAPLEEIDISRTPVQNISPLANKKIRKANLGYTGIKDLSPLAGQPVEDLNLSGWHIDDKTLAIIKKMPLRKLILTDADVENIEALEGMNIEYLSIFGTKVTNFAPLLKLPKLRTLFINNKARDLSQIKTLLENPDVEVFISDECLIIDRVDNKVTANSMDSIRIRRDLRGEDMPAIERECHEKYPDLFPSAE